MSITFWIIFAIIKCLQSDEIWSIFTKSIDKAIKEDAEGFSRFKENVFLTLDQTKHPLGKDGFERLV